MRCKKMKMGGVFGVLAVLLVTITGVAANGETKGVAGHDPDGRLTLALPNDERHMVLEEMRNFVVTVHMIMKGLSNKDFKMVAGAAKKMGSGAANEIPPRVVAKLPETFKMLAGKTHGTFDAIAMDAIDMEDTEHTINQLSTLYETCIACHAMYQVDRLR